MLTRLGRHVGLLQQASRTPGVQSGKRWKGVVSAAV